MKLTTTVYVLLSVTSLASATGSGTVRGGVAENDYDVDSPCPSCTSLLASTLSSESSESSKSSSLSSESSESSSSESSAEPKPKVKVIAHKNLMKVKIPAKKKKKKPARKRGLMPCWLISCDEDKYQNN